MVATTSEATAFDLRTPYLQQGRTTDVRAQTDLLTIQEAAQAMRLSPVTVRRLIAAGRL